MNNRKVLDNFYYTFNPTTRTITFINGYYPKQEEILLIVNLHGNKLIYNFACENEGGTLSGNVLTLVYNTTTMSSTDKLMIIAIVQEDSDTLNTILTTLQDSLLDSKLDNLVELLDNTQNTIEEKHLPYFVFKNINTATTTTCKLTKGVLHKIIFNTPSNNSIIMYDAPTIDVGPPTTAAPKIATIAPGSGTQPFELEYNIAFDFGLTITTAGTADITVVYK